MESGLVKMALSQGLGYALFVFLLIYVLQTTKERENRLNVALEETRQALQTSENNNTQLVNKLTVVEEVRKDVQEIKNKIK